MEKQILTGLDEMANFTFTTKYAKYDEKKKRRETWDETVSRVEKMHLKKFSLLSEEDKKEITKAFDFVREKKVTPSMRSMQFGGKAVEAHNARIFNCSVRHIDSIRSFAESFYALLCGTGVGFGLTDCFLNRLPDLVNANDKTGTVITYVVQDNIEGWGDSIEALLNCYFKNTPYSGRKIVFDYSRIRPKGAKLKTGGGKAPGYKGLKNCHKKVKMLLDSLIEEKEQKRLKTIDAYDILMHCADAVLSGGIRRSACSVIFEASDEDMMNAKTGNWFNDNPQRARSNNSALVSRNISFEEFNNLIERTKEFGEPGFVFGVKNQLLNPCFSLDTKILTEDGWRSFSDLLEKESVVIKQDSRIFGKEKGGEESWEILNDEIGTTVSNIASNIKKTGENQEIFELTLNCGRSVKATKNHHFATKNGMKRLSSLKIGDKILTPVNEVFKPNSKSKEYILGYLTGMIYGDGVFSKEFVRIDVWTNEKNAEAICFIEEACKNLINEYKSKLNFQTNVSLEPKFSKNNSSAVGNVTKYSLSSVLLHQILKLNGIFDKNDASWLHYKGRDFKSGFLSGMFFCDGHFEYSENKHTPSLRLTSINFDLLKNIQLVIQELGALSNIKLLKRAGLSLLPDGNRNYKEYKTKESFRLIIGGKLNCLNAVEFINLPKKDRIKFSRALNVSKKDYKTKYYSTVESIKSVGREDVYCLKEDKRRTLIAEGMSARRCFEISFLPMTEDGRCGFQMCNLTSINGAKVLSEKEFFEAAWAASLIGTLQAAYTTFPYLGHTSEELTREESLLGVSITGMMDNPNVLFNPKFQKEAAKIAVETNKEWAKKIGINQAARVTCIKPEGTNSIVLSAASGIHPHHARRYFRRIQVNKEDNVYKYFKMFNEHACEESVWSANKVDDVITFPIEIPEKAKIKTDLTAIEHLKLIKLTQENWVNSGTTEVNNKPLAHSVSCTVVVKDEEWEEVTQFLFKNQKDFTAVSLLPFSGDKIYKQAPMEAVVTPEDEKKFEDLVKNWSKVEYKKLQEDEDTTSHAAEAACANGACEVTKV